MRSTFRHLLLAATLAAFLLPRAALAQPIRDGGQRSLQTLLKQYALVHTNPDVASYWWMEVALGSPSERWCIVVRQPNGRTCRMSTGQVRQSSPCPEVKKRAAL